VRDGAVLLALAAALSALGGLIATLVGARRGKQQVLSQAEQDCHERLLKSHREAEALSDELHALKMARRE
jgi:hypothetical protein